MSFATNKRLMEEGDTVLLYVGYDNLVQMQLARGSVHQTRYGALKHDQLIGAPYGKKVECSKGWICPLQPTPELWTLALPHRTQILYTTDISMIVFQLHLKPGSVVVEAGTGSGSLSHALIRSVMPTGRLHTFEFHEERCAAARKEFEQHGLGDYVTAKHRDVCAAGFELDKEADALFLDLPAPWECITSASHALRQGGRICTFSPCMEQVQRTCEALKDHGFTDLTTLECLSRPFTVQNIKLSYVDFGDQTEITTDKKNTVDKAAPPCKKEREDCEETEVKMETEDQQTSGQGSESREEQTVSTGGQGSESREEQTVSTGGQGSESREEQTVSTGGQGSESREEQTVSTGGQGSESREEQTVSTGGQGSESREEQTVSTGGQGSESREEQTVSTGGQGSESREEQTVSTGGQGSESREEQTVSTGGQGSESREEQTVSTGGQARKCAVKARELKTGAPPLVMQGHTGFLTFASLY